MEQGNFFVIVLAIVAVIIIGNQLNLFSTFDYTQNVQFEQFTSSPRVGTECDEEYWWTSNKLISSNIANLPSLLSNFKFETTTYTEAPIYGCLSAPNDGGSRNVQPTFIDSDSCQHWRYEKSNDCQNVQKYTSTQCVDDYGWDYCYSTSTKWGTYIYFRSTITGGACSAEGLSSSGGDIGCRNKCYTWTLINDYGGKTQTGIQKGCFYTFKAYKDGLLIDEITTPVNSATLRAYSDSGTVVKTRDLPFGESGYEIYFGEFIASNPGCDSCSVKNWYRLYIPEGRINISLSTPKPQYLQGELVKINVTITNNLQTSLIGALKIKYNVPTILGEKERIDIYNVTINKGLNKFNYEIPTVVQTADLQVTPSIIVYQRTAGYSGVNVFSSLFEEFGIGRGPITANDKFRVISLSGDSYSIRIVSEAESLRAQLDLLQNDVDALQALLDEKAYLLNQLELTLQEQISLIESYELLIDEKIYLVSQLELTLQEQISLVEQLELTRQEQAKLINSLQLNNLEQAQLISQLHLTNIEQGILINQLEISNQDQAQIINALDLEISEQVIIINQLDLTTQQQAQLISQLHLTSQEQGILIENLHLEISNQAIIINNLNINLQQKILLISQLKLTNAEQQELVNQLSLSLSDQQEILDALNIIISSDAQYILDLQLSLSQSAYYINSLELNIQQQAQIISQLQLTISQQAQLISQLRLSNEEVANLIIEMDLTISQQAQIISQLKLTNAEQAQIINALQLSIAEDADLISQLQISLQEKADIISALQLSIAEEAQIIDLLKLTIDEQLIIIGELELSFAEEQELVSLLSLTIEEQLSLIEKLKDYQPSFDFASFFENNKIIIFILGGVLLLFIFVGGKKK